MTLKKQIKFSLSMKETGTIYQLSQILRNALKQNEGYFELINQEDGEIIYKKDIDAAIDVLSNLARCQTYEIYTPQKKPAGRITVDKDLQAEIVAACEF